MTIRLFSPAAAIWVTPAVGLAEIRQAAPAAVFVVEPMRFAQRAEALGCAVAGMPALSRRTPRRPLSSIAVKPQVIPRR